MKKTDYAYMAGIFDGEGCIRIRRSHGIYLSLSIILVSTDRWLCEYFAFAFGGISHRRSPQKAWPKAKTQYGWICPTSYATDFLETLLPYLKLKRAEAELGILFQSEKYPLYSGQRLTDDQRVIQEAQYILMRKLKRGSHQRTL